MTHKLKEIAQRIVDDARKTVEVLASDRQALWSVFRSSVNARFTYWTDLVRPSLCKPVALWLDKQLWSVLEAALGFSVPQADHLLGSDCVLTVPVFGLEAKPFSQWVVRQPIRLQGMGVRGAEDNCEPGWIGSLDMAAPYLAQVPALMGVMGGEISWGPEADPATRWSALLASGHILGQELRASWLSLQQEAQESAIYLGEQVEGALGDQVEAAGKDGREAGSLRHSLVERRETVRGRVLQKALEEYQDRSARPVMSWRERDKHSSAWLLCLPGPSHFLSNEEFSEAACALLCRPSVACSPRVGERFGRGQVIGQWGDEVVNCAMRGDGWRRRHDALKMLLLRLLTWAGIPVTCEVFNLFARCIPQDGLNRIEHGRRRQGLVPDFLIPAEEGGGSGILCEVKAMSASKTHYPLQRRQGNRLRAVDKRAGGLTEAYAIKARQTDWNHCGTARPPIVPRGAPQPVRQIGPVESKLLSFGRVHGWVFGAYGEVSEDVHLLVQRIANSRLDKVATLPGRGNQRKSRAAQLSALVADVRRQLSLCSVKQQARLLLDRLCLIGDGATEAGRRRDWAAQLEVEAARRRKAQEVSRRQGRSIVRHGFPML